MKQLDDIPWDEMFGCKATSHFDGSSLAEEAWGDHAESPSLIGFAYLWRRFGPPWRGSDDYKSLVNYYLSTEDPDVALWITISGSSFALSVGGVWNKGLETEIHKPEAEWEERFQDWWLDVKHPEIKAWEETPENRKTASDVYWNDRSNQTVIHEAKEAIGSRPLWPWHTNWREQTGPVHQINLAVFNALKELERPVYIRDVAINIFGRCDHSGDCAEHSPYAGYGIPKEAMDALVKGGKVKC